MEPKVLNAKEVGTVFPNSVYCGRPSKWGNPFKSGVDGTRTEVIAMYQLWIEANPELIKQAKDELAGKNLICWCKPKSCHCDILLEIANSQRLTSFF